MLYWVPSKSKEAIGMIDLENVSKTYAKNQVKALDHLSLHVDSGELFGFIGPNGAGKTTAIKLMTGIRPLRPADRHGVPELYGGYLPGQRRPAQESH